MKSALAVKAIVIVATTASCLAGPAIAAHYELESELVIPSPNSPNWDYLAFDPATDLLYIARREDGVLLYDAKTRKIVGALDNTVGGNATTLIPELDRGYVTNMDGSLTTFQPSTRKVLKRIKVGKSADNAFYEPVNRQLVVTMGDDRLFGFVDATSGAVLGTLAMDSERLEGTAADGLGNVYTALRDRNRVVRIDVKNRRVTAEWTPKDCELPNGAAYDRVNKRLFITCRGEHPIIAVMDEQGNTVAQPAIGRGNDVILFDTAARRLYTSNGFDGTLVIIDQIDANTYKLAMAITTRPYARTMALDPKTKRVYLVTADGMVDPAKAWKQDIAPFYPNTYFRDTFRLLVYSVR